MVRRRREPGEDPIESPAPAGGAQACAWTTGGQRCQLLATIYKHPTGSHPGHCAWHFECLAHPRLVDDFEEFERWVAIKRKRYCTQFSHHPPAYLWEALRGRYRPPGERLTVVACERADCWVPDVLAQPPAAPAVSPRTNVRQRSAARP